MMISDLKADFPIEARSVTVGMKAGLVIIDEIVGFAALYGGAMAPKEPNAQIQQMVSETDRLARAFLQQNRPVFVFKDCHLPGSNEPPYPPHCEKGSGEEELVPELRWLNNADHVTHFDKDCINGYIGAIRPDGTNAFAQWVNQHRLEQIFVVGVCTDICVMDFVLTLLSARNHGQINASDIVVYDKACATYDLQPSAQMKIGHPQAPAHHMGMYFMASRGAIIADKLTIR